MAFLKRWSTEIGAAGDEAARRQLLGKIGVWRATHLTDLPASREAAGAMARLYALLGDMDAAHREARSLVSLCQTTPASPKEDVAAAQGLLQSLGGGKAIVAGRSRERGGRERGGREDRERRGGRGERREGGGRDRAEAPRVDRVTEAMQAAKAGRWQDAERSLAGGKGARVQLARTWVRLAWALSAPDESAQLGGVRDVESWLRQRLDAPAREAGGRETTERAPGNEAAATERAPAMAHPLDDLLGVPTPRRWRDRLALLDRTAAAHPDQIDRLAALALDHHVALSGERSPAPWLANLVSQALAAGGEETTAKIAAMRKGGVFAVSLYSEDAFDTLVAVRAASEGLGWRVTSVRRGVLSRGADADRRAWTLRAVRDGVEYMLAVAPVLDQAWPVELAAKIATRLPGLCERVALFAPGDANGVLRDAATSAGVTLLEGPDPAALLGALGDVSLITVPPSPRDALGELLVTGVPDHDALRAAIEVFPRVYLAFKSAGPVLAGRTDDDVDAARVAFLRAADAVAPPSARMPEGTTWTVRLAARGADDGLLADTRYGGVGVTEAVAVAHAMTNAGLEPDRVLSGPTKRERRGDDVLSALDSELGGLWRLRAGKREVAVLSGLTPEGKAAATRLLLDDAPRVVVIPVDGDLLAWWREVGGADPIGWTGDEGADVVAAAQALTV